MLNFKKKTKKNICLIGLMGSGKSVIGKDLSKIYNFKFLDSDMEIERETGETINSIFLNYGEEYFREKEEKVCLKLLDLENYIISLGGGSILNKKIREKLNKNSHSIYLKVEIDILLGRLKNSKKRPLLNNINKREILEKLYKERKIFYNKADLIIKNNFNKNEILAKINSSININE
tara:strand:- start:1528 stop:2058 length:531 start_codon:yes stop_codon:yes gene_type:complete